MTSTSNYADAETPLIRNCWYVAGLASEFTRELKERYLLGNSALMFMSTKGRPVLLQNRCAHRSFPLHHGRLEGDEVVCMYHGLRYDTEGACVDAPMIKRPAVHAKLRRYPLAERGPLVWAWMGDAAAADESCIPDTAWLTDEGWTSGSGYVHAKANYVGLQENLLDLTHFDYLHEGNIGTPEWIESTFEVTLEDERVRTVRRLVDAPPPMLHAVAMKLTHRQHVTRVSDAWFMSPAMNVAFTSIEDLEAEAGQRRVYGANILHLITPETQHSLHYWAFLSRDYALEDEGVTQGLVASAIKAFHEDREALEWIEELDAMEGRPPRAHEASFASDRGSMAMRKIIRQMANAEAVAGPVGVPIQGPTPGSR
ncbi:MAG: aromatic ring-hydroxylating dioxygenase subunit alpha [Variovorax sp.]